MFCSNPKGNGEMLLVFCLGDQVDANLRGGLQKHVISSALY